MHIPYLLTLSYGWTKFAIYQNIAAVILLVPSMIWATIHYGAIGAAWIWLILNAGYVFISVHFLYRRLLVTEKWRWYRDIAVSSMAVFLVGRLCVLLLPEGLSNIPELVLLLTSGILMVGTAWLFSPSLQRYFFGEGNL